MEGLSFFVADDDDDDECEWWKSFVNFDDPELRDKLSSSLDTLLFKNTKGYILFEAYDWKSLVIACVASDGNFVY